MKIFINTFGSRGDVQPYIILGKVLKDKAAILNLENWLTKRKEKVIT